MSEEQVVKSYEGKLDFASYSGEASFLIEEDALCCSLPFRDELVAYEEISQIEFKNLNVLVHKAAGETYRIYFMGQETEWLYHDLCDAYNAQVCAVLKAQEERLSSHGMLLYEGAQREADIKVFADGLYLLPPDKSARRYPAVFINDIRSEGYQVSVALSTGETVRMSMLGREQEPVERFIKMSVSEAKKAGVELVREACPAAGERDVQKAARLMAGSKAASLLELPEVIAKTLVKKAKNSKMGAVYDRLCALAREEQLSIGVRALDPETVEELKAALLEKLNENSEVEVTLTSEQEDALKWVVWAVVPSQDGAHMIVEFAFPNEAAATYIFRTDAEAADMLPLINRAFDATGLEREVFSADWGKLSPDMRMLAERTPAIMRLRELFSGKAAHQSPQAWENAVKRIIAPAPASATRAAAKFCGQCGARLTPAARFCGQCGARL